MDYQIIELEEFNVIGIRYELSKSLSNNVKLAYTVINRHIFKCLEDMVEEKILFLKQ